MSRQVECSIEDGNSIKNTSKVIVFFIHLLFYHNRRQVPVQACYIPCPFDLSLKPQRYSAGDQ